MRELVVLGTASQAPTRHRNHNGYLLRWDGEAILFDPGEGTQRQFTLAGVSAASVDRICITHFHGDHCLGLPGMIMRLSLDAGSLPVPVHYPASGQSHFERLRFATAGQEHVPVDGCPVTTPGVIHQDDLVTIRAMELSHRVDAVGYRVEEPDRRHMIVERLDALGITGPAIGRLQEHGSIDHDGRTVNVEEVSEHRRGQVFAFVMDTRWCPGALQLAAGADLLVCESTFLDVDADMAEAVRASHGAAGRSTRTRSRRAATGVDPFLAALRRRASLRRRGPQRVRRRRRARRGPDAHPRPATNLTARDDQQCRQRASLMRATSRPFTRPRARRSRPSGMSSKPISV